MYVSALVAYDGTDYAGFQVQDGVATIQGELERALSALKVVEGRVIGAGRTDAGVHASGQAIAAEVAWRHDCDDLERAWNAYLPPSIQVRRVKEVSRAFHPRFSAVSRTYRYTVMVQGPDGRALSTARRSPLTDRFALSEPGPLDVEAMGAAAQCLIGEHDYATFGRPPQGENTVRRVLRADWQRVVSDLEPLTDQISRQLVFTIQANAFLQRMVRAVVGTLLEVGRGRRTPADVAQALADKDRQRASPPAAPQGLVLERVDYPAHLSPWSDDGRSVHAGAA